MIIRGKRYKLVYCDMQDYGECDPDDKPKKEIRINASLKGLQKLDTLLHEALHACFWDLSESAIAETATDLAHILWREGFTNGDETETITRDI